RNSVGATSCVARPVVRSSSVSSNVADAATAFRKLIRILAVMTSSAFETRRPGRPSIEDSPIGRIALAAAHVWMYIGGPIVLYNTARISIGRSYFPLTEDEHQAIPASVREYLDIAEARLAGVGFGLPTRARLQVPDMSAIVSLLEHSIDGAI